MKLSDIGEFGFIDKVKSLCNTSPNDKLIEGIGDDCAVYTPSNEHLQIVTCDAMVEGIHFKFEYFEPYALGRKSIAVNLSDIAAMSGIPRYALISLQIPPSFRVESLLEFYRGAIEMGTKFDVRIIGGNTASSLSGFSVHITMTGEVEKDRMASRDTARPGDLLFVTGTIGDAAAGLEMLESNGKLTSDLKNHPLVQKYFNPVPRLNESRILTESGIPSSVIDVSDGIASDLKRICNCSEVGAKILENRLPVSKELLEHARKRVRDPYDYAFYGGEDYELLFTAKSSKEKNIRDIMFAEGMEVTCIGEITADKGILLEDTKGCTQLLKGHGFDHF